MAAFQPCDGKLQDLSSSMAAFGRRDTYCHQTADLGGFMAAFGIWQKVAMKLLALEVLWPLSSNCRPWRFYGHFWEMKERDTKFGNLTGSLSQYSDSALFCEPALLILTILWFRFAYGLFNDCSLTPWHLPDGNTCHIWHLLSSVTG